MYEHRMKLFDGHFIFNIVNQLFVCIRMVVQGEPLGMEISGAQGICKK